MLPESWSGHRYGSCSEENRVNYTALLDHRPCVGVRSFNCFICRLDDLGMIYISYGEFLHLIRYPQVIAIFTNDCVGFAFF